MTFRSTAASATSRAWRAALGLFLGLLPATAFAVDCGNDGAGFDSWLQRFKAHAIAQGISQRAVTAGLAIAGYDPATIRLDRSQRSFKLSFEEFYARRVSPSLISRARSKLAQHRELFQRIEQRFGVPGPVLAAIWGLETNFGGDGHGGKSIIRSVSTLAYDCRRAEFFQNELTYALRIIDRGDMSPDQLRGGWAGEIGPMQFLPSSFFKYAVDFDGDGQRNLQTSIPDMLASTANFLKTKGGWRAGQGWEAGSANYAAILEWNKAEVYARTISVLASRLAGG